MPIAIVVAALLAPGGVGNERLFGDWAVACDNVARCEATVLMPESWAGDRAPELRLAREAGPGGAVTIEIEPTTDAEGIADLLIDRRVVASGILAHGSIKLDGGAAEGLARSLANGRALAVRLRRKTIATLSLKGSSAVMRYIDAAQGRAGGVSALVARGPRSATEVPPAAKLPRVAAVRPTKGKPAALGAAAIAALAKQAGCDTDHLLASFKPELHRLDARATLVLVPCISGAYQGSSAIYVLKRGGQAEAAPFDFPPPGIDPGHSVPTLTEAEWDEGEGSLNSHAKGRGLGDCGINQSWVWDGTRFRMTFTNGLDACRLSGSWLTRYRAQAVYR